MVLRWLRGVPSARRLVGTAGVSDVGPMSLPRQEIRPSRSTGPESNISRTRMMLPEPHPDIIRLILSEAK
jgi:hypothetical protein